jgi:hypothetical protein
MTQTNSYEYLKQQIAEKLGGDERRVVELFENESIYDVLVACARDSDWYHYQKRTFDGWYLVRGTEGFEVYYQERGAVMEHATFTNLREAATYFFGANGYLRS